MKTVIAICMGVFMMGCQYLFVPNFDGAEYAKLTEITTTAVMSECRKDEVEKLLEQTTYLVFYTKHMPRNEKMFEGAKELQGMVITLYKKFTPTVGKPSDVYCAQALGMIIAGAESLAQASGGKTR